MCKGLVSTKKFFFLVKKLKNGIEKLFFFFMKNTIFIIIKGLITAYVFKYDLKFFGIFILLKFTLLHLMLGEH